MTTRTRRRPEKPLDKHAAEFVIWHLADRSAFAPFTGTDWDAWKAYVPTLRLWGRMRDDATTNALRAIVGCAQRHADVLAVFKKAIPCLLDWPDERRLWDQIYPRRHLGDAEWRMPVPDGKRICRHENNRPRDDNGSSKLECRDCGLVWQRGA